MLDGLLKFDTSWKAAPFFAFLAAMLWLGIGGAAGRFAVFTSFCVLAVVLGLASGPVSLFEAALPIPGRRLVAARLAGVSAMLWIPALAMIAETAVLRGWKDALPLLEVASLATLVVLAGGCFLMSASLLIRLLIAVLFLAAVLLFVRTPGILSHWAAVIGFSLGASAVLLARLRIEVPEGFQIAPSRTARVVRFAWRRPPLPRSRQAVQSVPRRAGFHLGEWHWKTRSWRRWARDAEGTSMLGELLDLEPQWKAAPFAGLLAAVLWPFMSRMDSTYSPMYFAILCVSVHRFHEHATPFQAALPIPGRQLVATRLLVAFALLWLPALAMIGETWVLRGSKDALPLLAMAAVVSLGVLAVQSFRIRQASPPSWITLTPWLAIIPLLSVPILLSHCGAVVGVSFAASAVLLARLWVSVPKGFQIAPAEATRGIRFQWRRPAWSRFRLGVWSLPWRVVFHLRNWLAVMPLAIWASLGSFLVLGALAVMLVVSACERLDWIAVLPISRRRLLLIVMLPALCLLLAIGLSIPYFESGKSLPMVLTGYSATWPGEKATGKGTPNVLVPASFWRWAGGGEIPAIESPWGEETQPRSFLRLGLICYNPFSVAPNNSARFLEWQFARATQAVYGRSIPFSQAAELRKPGWIPIPRQLKTHFVALLAAALIFLGMLHLAFWRKTKGGVGWTWIVWFCVLVPFFIDLFTANQVRESGSLSGIIAMQLAAILPQNWAALVALAALLVGGLYLAVERQFKKMDLIPKLRPAKGQE